MTSYSVYLYNNNYCGVRNDYTLLFAHIYAYSSCAITCVDIVKLLTEVYLYIIVVCINVSPNVIHLTYHPVVFMLETIVTA